MNPTWVLDYNITYTFFNQMFIRQSCKTWATLKFVQALLKPKASNHIVRVWLGYRITSQKNWDPTRWAPTIYKWNYKPYQWPDKWVARIFNPTQRGYIYIWSPPPWSTYKHFIWELPVFYAHFFYQKNDILMFLFLLTEILRSMGATQSWKDDAGSEK